MTKKQQEIIERLRKDILEHDGFHTPENYEYKKFEIREDNPFGIVFLITNVGSKEDENTLAAVLCRTTRHICIRKNGGIELLNASNKKRTNTLKHPKRGYWNAIHALTYY